MSECAVDLLEWVAAAQHIVQNTHVVRVTSGLSHVIGVAPFARGYLGPAEEESALALGIEGDRLEYFELQLRKLAEQVRELL